MKNAFSAQRVDSPRPAVALDLAFHPVIKRTVESDDVVTLDIDTGVADERTALSGTHSPGQFNMLYVFGVGEIPISISGLSGATNDVEDNDAGGASADPLGKRTLIHTIRGVGPVSNALLGVQPGQQIGLRGPYGRGWPVATARGKDVLLIAGGIGMAPLRPVLYHLLRHRNHYGRVALLYGARCPEEQIFKEELLQWQADDELQVQLTVDRADSDWRGNVGVVTQLIDKVEFDPVNTCAMICGPDIMFRFASMALAERGMPSENIYLSMERNMQCAIGSCGHCQFGAHFVCKDGPVFSLAELGNLLSIREL